VAVPPQGQPSQGSQSEKEPTQSEARVERAQRDKIRIKTRDILAKTHSLATKKTQKTTSFSEKGGEKKKDKKKKGKKKKEKKKKKMKKKRKNPPHGPLGRSLTALYPTPSLEAKILQKH
jgi:hypothetical protein